MHVAMVLQCDSDLSQIVCARGSPRSFAVRLHRRKQQRRENADDRNDHQ
jgi:hypothetical protein